MIIGEVFAYLGKLLPSFVSIDPPVKISLFGKKHQKKYTNIVKLLNGAICYNQGALAEYSYTASIRHKKIKEEFNTKRRKKELSKYSDELVKYLYNQLDNVFKENVKKYLFPHFEERLKSNPRICVKAHNQGKIIDLYRSANPLYKVDYPIESNTGFHSVFLTGQPYIENSIPKAAKEGNYKNPRLINERLTLYNLSRYSKIKNKIRKEDREWVKCWKDSKSSNISKKPSSEECYKSTLLVPMTLRGNVLSPEFKLNLNIMDFERSIYGYLCFDHCEEGFFNEVVDIPIGYIFADILSLYLITVLIYTEYSSTFQKVNELIKE